MRGPTRRLVRATPDARRRNHVSDPAPTPAISAAVVEAEPANLAVLAAEKIAAQLAIVRGFEAVAPSEVSSARRGLTTSSATSPPSRTRKALQSIFSPR